MLAAAGLEWAVSRRLSRGQSALGGGRVHSGVPRARRPWERGGGRSSAAPSCLPRGGPRGPHSLSLRRFRHSVQEGAVTPLGVSVSARLEGHWYAGDGGASCLEERGGEFGSWPSASEGSQLLYRAAAPCTTCCHGGRIPSQPNPQRSC